MNSTLDVIIPYIEQTIRPLSGEETTKLNFYFSNLDKIFPFNTTSYFAFASDDEGKVGIYVPKLNYIPVKKMAFIEIKKNNWIYSDLANLNLLVGNFINIGLIFSSSDFKDKIIKKYPEFNFPEMAQVLASVELVSGRWTINNHLVGFLNISGETYLVLPNIKNIARELKESRPLHRALDKFWENF